LVVVVVLLLVVVVLLVLVHLTLANVCLPARLFYDQPAVRLRAATRGAARDAPHARLLLVDGRATTPCACVC
jgi:hypothetical protein